MFEPEGSTYKRHLPTSPQRCGKSRYVEIEVEVEMEMEMEYASRSTAHGSGPQSWLTTRRLDGRDILHTTYARTEHRGIASRVSPSGPHRRVKPGLAGRSDETSAHGDSRVAPVHETPAPLEACTRSPRATRWTGWMDERMGGWMRGWMPSPSSGALPYSAWVLVVLATSRPVGGAAGPKFEPVLSLSPASWRNHPVKYPRLES
ncbi:hypothetical protein BZA05DRAFT_50915 [Tricharina praecox]|uniref:uncharacterized protein n=1 Tax=Tricharina praecox TaxID=43433 RepID=UPI0022200E35|nr:uncharacterized protein BZA05DRAFT_50915 [Tricharina praecox]KAI5850834.1 hypothetical protein BZA05DRAFT_50915 [Tricharina praecox]